MSTREAATAALALYKEIAALDVMIEAMETKPCWGDTPLQKVTFFLSTATFSGPKDYKPTLNAPAIAACILTDMRFARTALVSQLEALGFAT